MVLPYDVTELRDAVVSLLSEEWWNDRISLSTLCEIVIKFDQAMRELKRANKGSCNLG